MALNRTLTALAFLASAIVLCMVVAIVATGFSQELFELAPSPALVADQLRDPPAHALGLRINLGLDNLFIVVYSAFFVLLAVRFRTLLSPVTIAVALAALLLTSLLDALENHHILMMLHAFQHGAPISADELQWQMVASNLKFHASYVSVFLFAFGFYRLGGLGRVIAWLLWFGYVPLGMITFVVPIEIVAPFALARTAFFVLGFALGGIYFLRDKETPAATVAAANERNKEEAAGARPGRDAQQACRGGGQAVQQRRLFRHRFQPHRARSRLRARHFLCPFRRQARDFPRSLSRLGQFGRQAIAAAIAPEKGAAAGSQSLRIAQAVLRHHREWRMFRKSLRALTVTDERVHQARVAERARQIAQAAELLRARGVTQTPARIYANLLLFEILCDAVADGDTATLGLKERDILARLAADVDALLEGDRYTRRTAVRSSRRT